MGQTGMLGRGGPRDRSDSADHEGIYKKQVLLEVADLRVCFHVVKREIRAVDQASLEISSGETVAIVGESGSGKSTLVLAVLGLLPRKTATVTGSIRYRGRELIGAGPKALSTVRGREIAMIFQDPVAALNPCLSVGYQVGEAVSRGFANEGRRPTRSELRNEVRESLEAVGLSELSDARHVYPHQLSGGQNQRVGIAMALASKASLLLADEPTTSLDMSAQSAILDLLDVFVARGDRAVLIVTHDFGVVARQARYVAVMYSGQIVEKGRVRDVLAHPAHPYTSGLISCLPPMDGPRARRLPTLKPGGGVPDGCSFCAFAPRCDRADSQCFAERPPLMPISDHGDARYTACWHPLNGDNP